jgi:hypothetical protein
MDWHNYVDLYEISYYNKDFNLLGEQNEIIKFNLPCTR